MSWLLLQTKKNRETFACDPAFQVIFVLLQNTTNTCTVASFDGYVKCKSESLSFVLVCFGVTLAVRRRNSETRYRVLGTLHSRSEKSGYPVP